MCRYWSTKCIVAVVMLYSAILFAGITKGDANGIVLNNIIGEELGNVNVYASNYTVNPTNPIVLWSREEVSTSYENSWAYFVDDYPLGKWHHPCRIIFVDNETGEYEIFEKTIFPVNYETEFELISEMAKTDTSELPVADTDQVEKALPNSNLYAVIINGSQHDEERFWNDMSAMYCTLNQKYGYEKSKVYIHYLNRSDIERRYDLDNDGIREDYLNPDKSTIEATFEKLATELGPSDQLLVYIDGHGNKANSTVLKSYIDLEYEDIYDTDLADYIKNINCAQMIFTIGCCYSGSFTHTLNNTDGACKNISVHTSSYDETAWAEYWITTRLYHEYFYYWIASVRGFYPGENPYEPTYSVNIFPTELEIPSHPGPRNPDSNSDSFVQMGEVFSYTNDFDTWSLYGFYKPQDERLAPEYPQNVFTTFYSSSLLSLKGLSGTLKPTGAHEILEYEPVDPDIQVFTGNIMINPRLTVEGGVYMKHSGDYTMTCVPDISKLPLDNGLIIEDQAGFILDGSNTVLQSGSQITMYGSSVIEAMGNSSLTGKVVTTQNSIIRVKENSVFTLKSGADVNIVTGARVEVGNNAQLIIEEGAVVNFDLSTDLILSEGAQLILNRTSSITNGLTVDMYKNSIIRTDEGKTLFIEDGSVFNLYEGSGIEIGSYGMIKNVHPVLSGDEKLASPIFNYCGLTGSWSGINSLYKSTVELNDIAITNAETGVKGSGCEKFSVTNSVFEGCVNGINIVECNNIDITGNILTGKNTGAGISIISSDGQFKNNRVENFAQGTEIVLSTPYVVSNKFNNNYNYGFHVTGYNSIPILVDLLSSTGLNNEIIDNGLSAGEGQGGQIFMKYSAGVYMNEGRNNVHSGNYNELPTVPCIRGISHLVSTKVALPVRVFIEAEQNYWGIRRNQLHEYLEFYFDLWKMDDPFNGYYLNYDPYALEPFSATVQVDMNTNQKPTPASQQLSAAMRLEEIGNYDSSIKLFENIIKKYEDSPEAYVAAARLPYVYLKAEKDTDPLIATYDEALESENTSNKKFFEQMKITTHIKSKKYDKAIELAEIMKAEAETEDDILLAELNLAIAYMMRNSQGKGTEKSNSSETISDILAKLNGTGGEIPLTNPSDITESSIPNQHELFQNYPNPFNPVTQIKFALAKTADIKLSVYNISGQLVSQLASGSRQAGVHTVDFDGSRFNSGVYYYTLEVEGKSLTQKMILMK